MPSEHTPIADSGRARGDDEIAALQSGDFCSHEPGVADPRDAGRGDDETPCAGTEEEHQRDEEDVYREGLNNVGEPHDERVDASAVVARHGSEQRPDDRRHQGGHQDNGYVDTRSVQYSTEHVATEQVGAQPMISRR